MDELTGPATHTRAAVLAIIAFVLASDGLAGAPSDDPDAIVGQNRLTISRALGIAVEKLRSPVCRQIFVEFHDPGDTSLEEILRESGETAVDRILRMRFHDGTRHRLCDVPGVSAVNEDRQPRSLRLRILSGGRPPGSLGSGQRAPPRVAPLTRLRRSSDARLPLQRGNHRADRSPLRPLVAGVRNLAAVSPGS